MEIRLVNSSLEIYLLSHFTKPNHNLTATEKENVSSHTYCYLDSITDKLITLFSDSLPQSNERVQGLLTGQDVLIKENMGYKQLREAMYSLKPPQKFEFKRFSIVKIGRSTIKLFFDDELLGEFHSKAFLKLANVIQVLTYKKIKKTSDVIELFLGINKSLNEVETKKTLGKI